MVLILKKELSTENEEKLRKHPVRVHVFRGAISVACDPCTFEESASRRACLTLNAIPLLPCADTAELC